MNKELMERIADFERHCVEMNNQEGAEVLHYAAKEIASLTAQLAQDEWVSVEDRLPEYGQRVLIGGDGHNPQMVYRVEDDDPDYYEYYTIEFDYPVWSYEWVTHWMPLPSPPKEKQE